MADCEDIAPGMLRISHRTTYRYTQPVRFLPHRLVIRPREGHDLRVDRMILSVSPSHHLLWSRDVFGNSVATLHFEEPAAELRIDSDVLVQRFTMSSSQRLASESPILYPAQYDPLEQAIMHGYLAPIYPEDSAAVQSWLDANISPYLAEPLDHLLLQVTQRIFETIGYRRREEKGVQSPGTTLALGNGSCRDVATFLMEAARHLKIASRFASGYLDCTATRTARGSTHAWTEIYFPNLGWRGFDATTGKRCHYGHILTGVSNHPRGVMPISGRYAGDAASYAGMTATVEFSHPPEITTS
jgi:transglutaminase-like putative cysteine protease